MNSLKRSAVLLAFALLLGWIVVQNFRIGKLAADNRRLAASLQAAQPVEPADKDSNEEELQRLRDQESELLKLRGEVNVLRRQLREAKAQQEADAQTNTAAAAGVAEPVRKFRSMAEITLQPGETAVTGGWETSPGKHTVVFATPTIINEKGERDQNGTQIVVSARFVELPQAMFFSLGLGQPNGHEALKASFQDERMRQLLKQFEDDETVISLAAPRLTTLSGRQSQVSVTESKTINGSNFEVGPTLDFIPTKLANGSIQMVLVPSLATENAAFSQ